MVWVIEQLVNGEWQFFRYSDHQVVTYTTKAQAQIALRRLPTGRYRIRSVRD